MNQMLKEKRMEFLRRYGRQYENEINQAVLHLCVAKRNGKVSAEVRKWKEADYFQDVERLERKLDVKFRRDSFKKANITEIKVKMHKSKPPLAINSAQKNQERKAENENFWKVMTSSLFNKLNPRNKIFEQELLKEKQMKICLKTMTCFVKNHIIKQQKRRA